MSEKVYNPEYLKPLDFINDPDPRSNSFSKLDPKTGNFKPVELKDHHGAVNHYVLKKSVPESIRIQFDTCKNLYLYAWFVYRFYPVTEYYAFTCLELALKERYKEELQDKKIKQFGLKRLLTHAIDKGHIKNEGFQKWHESAWIRAKSRHEFEKMEEMLEKGLNEIIIDNSEVDIKDIDRNWDYINILKETLPELRNHYAHGSTTLHNQVLGTIQIVSEIINQIYE